MPHHSNLCYYSLYIVSYFCFLIILFGIVDNLTHDIFFSPPLSVQSLVFMFSCIEDNAHFSCWGEGVYTSVHTHTFV